MKKYLIGLLLWLSLVPALGQSVTQTGSVTSNQPAVWATNGVVKAGGTATNSPITGLGTTSNTGPGYCASSALPTAAGRQQFCVWANTTNGVALTAQNYGTASAASLKFTINAIDSLTLAANGGILASPTVTGGSMGVGTINATQLYVNGVAVSSGSGSGTVTSVAIVNGTGLTSSGTCTITTSGTCTLGFASIATNTVWGNVTAGTAVPTALSKTQLTTLINAFSSTLSGAAPASGGGTTTFLRADGTWATPAASAGTVTSAVIAAGSGIGVSGTCTITTTGTCTVALASISANTVLGSIAGGVPAALTATQLTTLCNAVTTSLSGCAPASGGGTSNFLRADGTWATPTGSGTVNSSTSGQIAYYPATAAAVSGNANLTISTSALTLGASGSAGSFLMFNGSTTVKLTLVPTSSVSARTLTFPDATDTLIGKATTDTLTNKTYDTAGSGNTFSINSNAVSAVTGTGATAVLASSPTLVTPTLGVATATSINGVTISSTTGTLTITSGKTFAASNTLTLTGTDSTSFAFPATSGTVGVLNNAATWSAVQTHSANLATTSASILVIGGGIRVPVTLKANADMPYTVLSSDYFICANLSPAASVTVTLPASPTAGDTYLVADCSGTAASGTPLTVSGNGNNINGQASYGMTSAYQSAAFTYNATTKWKVN